MFSQPTYITLLLFPGAVQADCGAVHGNVPAEGLPSLVHRGGDGRDGVHRGREQHDGSGQTELFIAYAAETLFDVITGADVSDSHKR